jgi:hypothetical protein
MGRAAAAHGPHPTDNSSSVPAKQRELLLAQYRAIKQQTSAGLFAEALAAGWQLLRQLDAAASADSPAWLCELLVATSLNVTICTAEAGPPDTAALQRLSSEAIPRLLSTLRW